MTLSIGIVGPLLIESRDCRLGKLPKKARALLAYLAAHDGRAVSRERLADLLWPYQSSEQSRHSLRNCLLELRKALGSAADLHLVADFANCRIRDVDVDLARFETLARSDHPNELQAAAELYRGEFLADFHITSEPFQEWLAAERDRTLGLVCEILQRMTIAQDASGEHEAAIRSGRRLVMLDPLSEFGQRALMRAYANAGRRGEALRQYKSCAENLKRELGVAPDHETQALANEVARSGAIGEASGIPDLANTQSYASPPAAAGSSAERISAKPPETLPYRNGLPLWPCLLPSIAVAVAPLRNLTGNSEQQYLVEAFTDDLVTDLMKHGHTLSLKPLGQDQIAATGPSAGMPATARAYDYVVTGSAQRSNAGTLRLNMRIVDAATSEYLWAGRHEFRPEDLGSTQTKITRRISRELHVLLLQAASRRALAVSGKDVDIGDCLSRAAAALEKGVRPELAAESQRWLLMALAKDPRNVEALAGLAQTCQYLVGNPWWSDPRVALAASDLGREAAAIALSIAPGYAEAHCIQGMLYSAAGQLEEAARAFNRAVTMDQGLGIAHGFAGYNASFLGRADETLPAVERAMRLDPTDRRHSIWLFFGGFAELLLGRTEEAITLLDKSLERNPSYGSAQLFMAAALSINGQRTQANERATAFRAQYPDYRTNAFEQLWLSRSSTATYRAQIHPLFEKVCALGVAN